MVNLAGPSMFFAGLILLIPHRIGMSRVSYIIKRYNLPISRAGLLLYKFHNNIELSLLFGCVIGGIITTIASIEADPDKNDTGNPGEDADGNNYIWFYQAGTNKSGSGGANYSTTRQHRRDFVNICMIITLFFMLLSSIIMYIIYISGGDFGHLNAFYLTLIFLTLCDGFTNAFAFCVNGSNSSLYAAAIPLSGGLVTLLHNIYKFFFDTFHWDDFDYYVLRLQLLLNIFGILSALLLWVGLHGYTTKVSAISDGDPKDASPIFMLAFSLGTVYAFYPSIAPYSIIDYQYASVIELWILVISSSPTLVFAILDSASDPTNSNKTYGPGGYIDWSGGSNVNWSSSGHMWNLVWICAIPYILCIQIFMSMLHYPDCLLSSFFNNKPFRIGFISVLFNTLREAMQAGGFAGAGKQKNSGFSGPIASWNKPITLFVMMFCVFTGDGYLQHYRRCCRDCWPTTGYNKYQSFFYWLHYGFKGGYKSIITSSFTDLYYHNLRPQFVSYASPSSSIYLII